MTHFFLKLIERIDGDSFLNFHRCLPARLPVKKNIGHFFLSFGHFDPCLDEASDDPPMGSGRRCLRMQDGRTLRLMSQRRMRTLSDPFHRSGDFDVLADLNPEFFNGSLIDSICVLRLARSVPESWRRTPQNRPLRESNLQSTARDATTPAETAAVWICRVHAPFSFRS